jgi:hypothetical protein
MRIEVTSEECMQMRTSATHCPLTYSGLGVLHYIVFTIQSVAWMVPFRGGKKSHVTFLVHSRCTRILEATNVGFDLQVHNGLKAVAGDTHGTRHGQPSLFKPPPPVSLRLGL